MRKIISIFLFFICITGLYPIEWREIIKTYGEAVCLIELVKDKNIISSGTGFVYGKQNKILTNAHVVKAAQFNNDFKIQVSFALSEHREKKYIAVIDKYSSDLDLAVLSSKIPELESTILGNSTELYLMDEVLVIGYPLGKNVKATPGYLQAFQHIDGIGEMLDISASVDPGNSGGPVFNSNGNIIGIVTAKIPGYNFNLALPVNLIKSFIEKESSTLNFMVKTNPPAARIFIDGKYKGQSPVEINFHNSALTISAEKSGFIRFEQKLESIPETGEFYINMAPVQTSTCLVTIISSPEGAQVLIDNNLVGTTPLSLELAHNSKSRIRLIKKRYSEYHYELRITNEDKVSLNLMLEK
jgi:V8-like Glu-specific endopeptidase